MIKSVTITNPKGEALELELTNPEKSGLIVKSIEGLGPPKATINGQELATSDGMYYSSARAQARQVIFTLAMYDRDVNSPYGALTIEQSRHLTYQYFPLKKEITIHIHTDTRIIYCKGYVESNNPNIFSKEEEAVISVLCPDPWLYTEGDEKTVFSGIRSIFEFPFSNETYDDLGVIYEGASDPTWRRKNLIPIGQKVDAIEEKKIEFGEIWLDTTAVLNYQGTVDTGILITIHAFDEAEHIVIYNVDTRERINIDTNKIRDITGKALGERDDIIISTVKGNRYCKLLRNGVYTNIISVLSRDTDWFQISAGNNGFGFSAERGEENLSVTFSYQNAYVGI